MNKISKKLHKITLLDVVKKLYLNFFRSPESKILAFLMILSLIISIFNHANLFIIIFKTVFYGSILTALNCVIYGGCRISFIAFFLFSIPLLGLIIQILDLLGWFSDLTGNMHKMYQIINKLSSRENVSLVLEDDHDKIRVKVKKDIDKFV